MKFSHIHFGSNPLRIVFFVVALVLAAVLGVRRMHNNVGREVQHDDAPEARDALELIEALPHIEVAATEVLRVRGLSGREVLAPDAGMLFVFDTPGVYGIWMKEMRFPIDIMWLDKNGIIVGVAEHTSPDSYPTVLYPEAPALFVLETNAGFADEHGLALGRAVTVPALSPR